VVETLLLALSLAGAAPVAPGGELTWTWEQDAHRRFYVDVEVQPPSLFTLFTEENHQARMASYELALALDCVAESERRPAWTLRCDIDQANLIGVSSSGDRGRLGVVLEELDANLEASHLQLVLRKDGRLTGVDLEGMPTYNRRVSQNTETARLLVTRAVAGLDLRLPAHAVGAGEVWAQNGGRLMEAPFAAGSQGSGEIAHRVKRVQDTRVVVQSVGRGMIAPATNSVTGPSDIYDSTLEGVAQWDVLEGTLVQRSWEVIGHPTAGSHIATGGAGYDYTQRGHLVLISEGDQLPPMPGSGERDPGPRAPGRTAIQLVPAPLTGDVVQ